MTEAGSLNASTVAGLPSVGEAARELYIYKVALYIEYYYFPVMFFFGLVGNILSFLVMLQKNNRSLSCCIYMLVLAVADTTTLVVYFSVWIDGGLLHRIKWFSCRFLSWVFNLSTSSSIWFITFVTMDRCLAIAFPLKFLHVHTARFSKKLILGTTLCLTLINSLHLFTTRLLNPSTCSTFGAGTIFSKVFSYFQITTTSIIPYIAVFTMNILIIRAIRKRTLMFGERPTPVEVDVERSANEGVKAIADNSQEQFQKAQKVEKDLAIMLVTISFAFLILTFPLFCRYFVYTNIDYKTSPAAYALYVFMYHLSNKLYMTNNAINFYLYCLSGAKFRKDVMTLFRCGTRGSSEYSSRSQDTNTSSVCKEDKRITELPERK